MGTWIVGGIVLLIAGAAVRAIYKDRKKGGCGGCSQCPSRSECGK